jgi:hypothetical protein
MKLFCRKFQPMHRNTLAGFAEVEIKEIGLVIRDVALHSKAGSRWAQPPAKPQLRDGALVTDDRGKIAYIPVVEFDSREARDRFSSAVIAAVLARYPSAFAGEAVA